MRGVSIAISSADTKGNIRHLSVLAVLAASDRELSVNDVAAAIAAPHATAHRLLTALVRERWVMADGKPRRYRASWRAVELGFAIARRSRIRQVALRAALQLAQAIRLQVTVALYEDGDAVITDAVDLEGEGVVPRLLGLRYPAGGTATGRVMLAYQPEAELRGALARPLPRLTEHTRTGREEVLAALPGIRERGYETSDREQHPARSGVQLPIFNAPGRVDAVLSVIIPGPLRAEAVERVLEQGLPIAFNASAELGNDIESAAILV